jgi:predicted ester cyclase
MIFAAFPGSTLSIDETIVDGDRVAIRFVQRGTHVGAFMGLPPTGREFAMTGQTVLHFRDGLVVERWSAADMFSLMVQLGAIPAPA